MQGQGSDPHMMASGSVVVLLLICHQAVVTDQTTLGHTADIALMIDTEMGPEFWALTSRKDTVYYEDCPGCKHEPVGKTKLVPKPDETDEQPCLSIDIQPNQKKGKPEMMITAKDALPEDLHYEPGPQDSVVPTVSVAPDKPTSSKSTPKSEVVISQEVRLVGQTANFDILTYCINSLHQCNTEGGSLYGMPGWIWRMHKAEVWSHTVTR